MKLDYGTLLSFKPLQLDCGCSIKSPTLKEIDEIGFGVYNGYLHTLLIDIDSYYSAMDNESIDYFKGYDNVLKDSILKICSEYESLSEQEKDNIPIIDILMFDPLILENIISALKFFTGSDVKFAAESKTFFICKENEVTGVITNRLYSLVSDLILQRNGIFKNNVEDKPKFKNKLAEKLYYQMQNAEKNRKGKNKADKNAELPNIISAVSARHSSINMLNIWDMTVYQLHDQFNRLQTNNIYDIQSMSVAAYGDEKGKFDAAQWYKNIHYQQ